jgi:hypothetical protein
LQIEDDEMEFNGLFIGECDLKKCRREMMDGKDSVFGFKPKHTPTQITCLF